MTWRYGSAGSLCIQPGTFWKCCRWLGQLTFLITLAEMLTWLIT